MKVSGTLDGGSIPSGATRRPFGRLFLWNSAAGEPPKEFFEILDLHIVRKKQNNSCLFAWSACLSSSDPESMDG